MDDYVDAEGLKGGFQNQLAVYGRLGEPCPRCGKPIVRTVIGNRWAWVVLYPTDDPEVWRLGSAYPG